MEQWLLAGYLLKKWRWLIKKVMKWILWGLVLSFVIWFVAVESGYGPAVETFINRLLQFLGFVRDAGSKYF